MSKWVTFHWHIVYGINDLKIHADKETALKYFNANCNKYFEINTRFKAKTLPATYGYPMRKFVGMSKPMFEKKYGKIGGADMRGEDKCI